MSKEEELNNIDSILTESNKSSEIADMPALDCPANIKKYIATSFKKLCDMPSHLGSPKTVSEENFQYFEAMKDVLKGSFKSELKAGCLMSILTSRFYEEKEFALAEDCARTTIILLENSAEEVPPKDKLSYKAYVYNARIIWDKCFYQLDKFDLAMEKIEENLKLFQKDYDTTVDKTIKIISEAAKGNTNILKYCCRTAMDDLLVKSLIEEAKALTEAKETDTELVGVDGGGQDAEADC